MGKVAEKYKEVEAYIIEMRRWFHAHPELSLEEKETSAKIKEELTKMDISFEELKPNYGIVATIEGVETGKTIVVRGDIDALPVKEDTGLDFASKNEGLMHACGHDAHIAMLLGTAKVLKSFQKELHGTVKLFFQVAEEVGKGVEEALAYFDTIGGVDQVIGLHIWSTMPEGEILLIPDAVFAGGSGFECKIHGQGGHGARPDLVNDPIKAACDLVLQISSIPSNYYDVLDHSVVSVGAIHSGTVGNVFPSEAVIKGTTRYYKEGGQKKLEKIMENMCEGVGKIHDVDVELIYTGGVIPVMNNRKMIERARVLVNDVEGLVVSLQTEPICAGDNFGYILEKYDGFYGVLGAGKREGYNYPQHHCQFDIQEESLRKGSEFMTRYVLDYLKA